LHFYDFLMIFASKRLPGEAGNLYPAVSSVVFASDFEDDRVKRSFSPGFSTRNYLNITARMVSGDPNRLKTRSIARGSLEGACTFHRKPCAPF
jgi:hypothetical protein